MRFGGSNMYDVLASPSRRKRCDNGSRRNKQGVCVRNSARLINVFPQMRAASKYVRRRKLCHNGSRRNKKTGKCVANSWKELAGTL